jgi:glutathione S-transferase
MILIGQYDSPFVRRVGIALSLYGLPFEQWPWSTWGDADKLRAYNPLTRVPTLILDDGDVLIESHIIIDHLDSLVPAEKRLFPTSEPARRRALKVAALGTGLGDKAVSLFYERRLHDTASDTWTKRCKLQIESVLGVLEADRAGRNSEWWFGDKIGHADIAVTAAMRFVNEVHIGMASTENFPVLGAHALKCESLPVFKEISQPFIAPT